MVSKRTVNADCANPLDSSTSRCKLRGYTYLSENSYENELKSFRKFIIISTLLFGLVFVFGFVGNVSAIGTYPAVDPNMVLYYHFNNQSAYGENDTHVYDFSGNGNNGTANNTLFQAGTGILGDGSFNFNGTGGLIDSPDILYDGWNYTYSAWINFTGCSTGSARIMGNSGVGSRSDISIVCSTSKLRFNYYNGSAQNLEYSTPITKNIWNYIVISVVNNSVDFYINGLLKYQSNSVNASNRKFIVDIGSNNGADTFFNGSLDEIIIYNKSLSSSEIWANYMNYRGCFPLETGLYVKGYTSICPGNYNVNSTGIIDTIENNTYINFTGVNVIGNGSKNFLTLSNLNNITIDGISGYNYTYLFNIDSINNLNIKNIYVSTYMNGWLLADYLSNVIIEDNSFGGLEENPTISGIYFRHSLINASIRNNTFRDCTAYGCVKFYNVTGNNINVNNNSFNGASSMLLQIVSSSNINITNNFFNDSNSNFDSYNVGILISRITNKSFSNNINIVGNTFEKIGCSSILTQGIHNLLIKDNVFIYDKDFVLDSKGNCGYEAPTAIDLASIWKTWTTDSSELVTDNYEKMLNYSAINISIVDNIFIDYPVLLKASAPFNLIQDLSNYWFESFATPSYLMPKQDYYISNDFNNLTTTFALVNNNPVVLSNLLGVGYPGFSTSSNKMFFKVHKDYLWFQNNFSVSGVYINESQNISLFNQTNALIYNTNGSIYGNSNINSNDGNINITLTPNNSSYVLDNFNLTEGISRQYSPLWFSSSTSTEKHIASNLTETISSTVVINVDRDCSEVSTITYTTDSGVKTTWEGNEARKLCSNGLITFSSLNIEPAQNSNVIEIEYGTTELASTFLKILIGFLAISIMLFAVGGFFIYIKNNFGSVSMMQFVEYSVLLLLFTILIIVLINHIINTL